MVDRRRQRAPGRALVGRQSSRAHRCWSPRRRRRRRWRPREPGRRRRPRCCVPAGTWPGGSTRVSMMRVGSIGTSSLGGPAGSGSSTSPPIREASARSAVISSAIIADLVRYPSGARWMLSLLGKLPAAIAAGQSQVKKSSRSAAICSSAAFQTSACGLVHPVMGDLRPPDPVSGPDRVDQVHDRPTGARQVGLAESGVVAPEVDDDVDRVPPLLAPDVDPVGRSRLARAVEGTRRIPSARSDPDRAPTAVDQLVGQGGREQHRSEQHRVPDQADLSERAGCRVEGLLRQQRRRALLRHRRRDRRRRECGDHRQRRSERATDVGCSAGVSRRSARSQTLSTRSRTLRSHMSSRPTIAYQPALDGVRALAVAAVLLFHGGVPGFDGGYLGVSVFFTLSGYLITSLLVHEHQRQRPDRSGDVLFPPPASALAGQRTVPARCGVAGHVHRCVRGRRLVAGARARLAVPGRQLGVARRRGLVSGAARPDQRHQFTARTLLVVGDRGAVLLGVATVDGARARSGVAHLERARCGSGR